ncbi:MAG: von Willebrand factor type A domain-containing protein [Myxococcales bacterium]|nr:von Willebrand factor type A domain-containing protein [Myxococcales bacterium]
MKRSRPTLSSLGLAPSLMALCLIASVAWADSPQSIVAGQVRAAGNGAPIRGATIAVGTSATKSDAAGNFKLHTRTVGAAILTVRHRQFRTHRRTLRLRPGQSVAVQVRLQRRVRRPVVKKEAEEIDRLMPAHRSRPSPRKAMKLKGYGLGAGAAMGSGRRSYGAAGRQYRMAARPVRRPMYDKPKSREGYDHTPDGDYHTASQRPLSTFSIDVDTASYSNVRRLITRNRRMPPADAVRIEELLNYFPYNTPEPTGRVPFGVAVELTEAPWNPKHRLARIAIQGRKVPVHKLPPANLVFLLDVSGSMHSPNKLPLLKRSLAMLAQQLRPQDRVSIVVYAGAAGLVLPPTHGDEQQMIMRALRGLRAGGSTAGGAGIKLAYRIARQSFLKGGNNRVILCTDGDFNVGQSSDGELVRMIEKQRSTGIFLTVLGFGTGNYQDAKMQKLADKGNGNHAYIDSLLEARKVLVRQMGGTLLTIAKDVKIQVEFNPARVKSYRLIGYANRKLAARDFKDDKKDAGELGAGHHVTALYELIPADGATTKSKLRYQRKKATRAAHSGELMHVKLRWKAPQAKKSKLAKFPVSDLPNQLSQASHDHRFAAAVAGFGMLLRKSKHTGSWTWGQTVALAQSAIGNDPGGYRAAFVGLAKAAARMTGARLP